MNGTARVFPQTLSSKEQELYDNALEMPAKFTTLTSDMEAMIEQGFLSKAEIAQLLAETQGMVFAADSFLSMNIAMRFSVCAVCDTEVEGCRALWLQSAHAPLVGIPLKRRSAVVYLWQRTLQISLRLLMRR